MVTPTSRKRHSTSPAERHGPGRRQGGALACGRGICAVCALLVGLGSTACNERQAEPVGQSSPSAAASPSPVPAAAQPPALRDLPAGDRAIAASRADGLVRTGQTRVELVSAGEPPRRLLRYRLALPERGRLVVTAQIAMTVHHPGEPPVTLPVPPLRVVLDLDVIPAEGDAATVSLTIGEVAVNPADEAEQTVAAEMAPVLAGLRSMASTFQLPPRGIDVGPLQPSRRPTPEVLQLWTTVGEAVRDLVIPYPVAEVGSGAQWKVFDRVRRAGIGMVRRTTYRVVALDDQFITLAAESREVAIASAGRRDPALPADQIIEVVRGDSTGSRAVVRPVDRLLPRDSESKLLGKITMDTRPPPELVPDGAARRSSVQLYQTLRVTPVPLVW
ncbi:MAG: hypothetical protein JRI68_09650 [Deltaproteobacteria bacterium]|nr:hypothetical protein [Deltaproteobacteria bacterium]